MNLTPVILTPEVIGIDLTAVAYDDIVFVYELRDDLGTFYVGTTVNPVARYLAHVNLTCRDSAPRIQLAKDRGQQVTMKVIDVTTRDDRLYLEARYINQTSGTVNSTRYHDHYRKWLDCPACYRSASQGTLTGPPRRES